MSDKLQKIKERWSNATAGPWKWINDGICLFPQNGFDYGDYIVFIQKSGFGNPHDAEAIVNSPTDVSWLIEQLEQAQAENRRLKEIDQQGIKCQMEYARQNELLTRENERLNKAIDRIGTYCVTELPQVSDFVLKVRRGEDF